jgi:hypothetical protein
VKEVNFRDWALLGERADTHTHQHLLRCGEATYITDKTRLGVPFCLQWQNARAQFTWSIKWEKISDCSCAAAARRAAQQRERWKKLVLHTQQHNYASCREAAEIEWPFKSRSSKSAAPPLVCVCFNKQENYIPTRYVKQPVGGNKIVQSACGSLCFALLSATANEIRSEILKYERVPMRRKGA